MKIALIATCALFAAAFDGLFLYFLLKRKRAKNAPMPKNLKHWAQHEEVFKTAIYECSATIGGLTDYFFEKSNFNNNLTLFCYKQKTFDELLKLLKTSSGGIISKFLGKIRSNSGETIETKEIELAKNALKIDYIGILEQKILYSVNLVLLHDVKATIKVLPETYHFLAENAAEATQLQKIMADLVENMAKLKDYPLLGNGYFLTGMPNKFVVVHKARKERGEITFYVLEKGKLPRDDADLQKSKKELLQEMKADNLIGDLDSEFLFYAYDSEDFLLEGKMFLQSTRDLEYSSETLKINFSDFFPKNEAPAATKGPEA